MVIQNNTISKYYNFILVVAIILINIIGYFITNKNYYYTLLFYPNKTETQLIYEKRAIIKGKTKTDKIRNTVEELLLGPIDHRIKNIFPLTSKLLSLRLEDDVLYLNFNRNTVLDVKNNSKNDLSLYKLELLCIVNSISYQYPEINIVKFYFEDKEYKYLGNFGPINEGIKPNWKILLK